MEKWIKLREGKTIETMSSFSALDEDGSLYKRVIKDRTWYLGDIRKYNRLTGSHSLYAKVYQVHCNWCILVKHDSESGKDTYMAFEHNYGHIYNRLKHNFNEDEYLMMDCTADYTSTENIVKQLINDQKLFDNLEKYIFNRRVGVIGSGDSARLRNSRGLGFAKVNGRLFLVNNGLFSYGSTEDIVYTFKEFFFRGTNEEVLKRLVLRHLVRERGFSTSWSMSREMNKISSSSINNFISEGSSVEVAIAKAFTGDLPDVKVEISKLTNHYLNPVFSSCYGIKVYRDNSEDFSTYIYTQDRMLYSLTKDEYVTFCSCQPDSLNLGFSLVTTRFVKVRYYTFEQLLKGEDKIA